MLHKTKNADLFKRSALNGVPDGIRTHGLSLRRRTLYPAELRRQIHLISGDLSIISYKIKKIKRNLYNFDLKNIIVYGIII